VIQVNRSALIAKVLKVPCQVQVSDLMSLYPAFQKYERNGVSAELVSSNSQNLSAETLQWAYALCKKNMQEMYEAAWGWSDKKKVRELQHQDAHFLIVNQQGSPTSSKAKKHLAYIHFRTTCRQLRSTPPWDTSSTPPARLHPRMGVRGTSSLSRRFPAGNSDL